MATRVVRVNTLKPGYNKPSGTLGEHHIMFFPKTKKVFGFDSHGVLVSNINVEKNDILLYDCGEVKVMTPWRARVYNLTGKFVKVVKEIKQDEDYCGDFYRKVNDYIGIYCKKASLTGRHYIATIETTSPNKLLKFLGKKDNVWYFKDMVVTERIFFQDGVAYENISYFGYMP